jgi:hypothetical protein
MEGRLYGRPSRCRRNLSEFKRQKGLLTIIRVGSSHHMPIAVMTSKRSEKDQIIHTFTNTEKFFLIKPTDALISQIYFVKKLYMFRAVPLPIMTTFPLHIRHWYMSCRFNDSFQARRWLWPKHVETIINNNTCFQQIGNKYWASIYTYLRNMVAWTM